MANFLIRDPNLAKQGKKKIELAESKMPVLKYLKNKYKKEKPLQGYKIAGCLHVTKETAVLVKTLKEIGAEVAWCGCNPLSTQDDIAASLAINYKIPIFAWRNNHKEYYEHIEHVLKIKPNLTLDDGADLVFTIHSKCYKSSHRELLENIIGGTEETTTGVHRLKAMAKDGKLEYPIIAVNDAETKWDFDNIYGTGQSSLDGILRATNILFAGKNVVVAGYGHCGKGVAMRAKGSGANVIVTEVDSTKALKAKMDGYSVMPMSKASKIGDIFITTTGCVNVITEKHFTRMKSGVILANAGHFNVEISVSDLEKIARTKQEVRKNNIEYKLDNGKKIYLLGEGRLVNLAVAEGHPSEVMDMSFANQLLSMLYLTKKKYLRYSPKVLPIPKEQDDLIAKIKLKTMDVEIDKLTKKQKKYLNDYSEGT